MAVLTRKQREIQEREGLILEAARAMLIEEGYLSMNMDRIARAVEYSKGTIYQHFSSKEDLLVALAVQTHEKRMELFRRAALFQGKPRERIQAVGVADDMFVKLYPAHFRTEQIIHMASVNDKAEDDRMRMMQSIEHSCFEMVSGIVRDAISQGDLVLTGGADPEGVTFGLWSMAFGTHFIAHSHCDTTDMGLPDLDAVLIRNFQTLLDGYGWKPLSSEWNYTQTRERILKEVFPHECKQLGG